MSAASSPKIPKVNNLPVFIDRDFLSGAFRNYRTKVAKENICEMCGDAEQTLTNHHLFPQSLHQQYIGVQMSKQVLSEVYRLMDEHQKKKPKCPLEEFVKLKIPLTKKFLNSWVMCLCDSCHVGVHQTFTNEQLAKTYHTSSQLLCFSEWIVPISNEAENGSENFNSVDSAVDVSSSMEVAVEAVSKRAKKRQRQREKRKKMKTVVMEENISEPVSEEAVARERKQENMTVDQTLTNAENAMVVGLLEFSKIQANETGENYVERAINSIVERAGLTGEDRMRFLLRYAEKTMSELCGHPYN